MDIHNAFKQAESRLTLVGDRTTTMHAKLEDLLFRAQKISAAAKNKVKSTDNMFGYDLQHFRRDLRSYAMEVVSLPTVLSAIERDCEPNPSMDKAAQALSRLAGRIQKQIGTLHTTALMAHQHMREAEHKVEGWYITQEVEELVQKTQGLPTVAQRIVLRINSTAPEGGQPPAPPAPPAA